MKILSTALLAAGLVSLSACGGNTAANNVEAENLTVPEDTGNVSDLGNVTDLNAVSVDNGTANLGADTNLAENSVTNAQ